MKLGIMQPYFLPYIGYWQLMNAVDTYVIYDDVNYIKGGWINRNRLLLNGQPFLFTIPLAAMSPYKKINEIAMLPPPDKLLKCIQQAYLKAPFFASVYPLVETVVRFDSKNLAEFLIYSIQAVAGHIGIKTTFLISSELNIGPQLSGQDRVLSMCEQLGATEYYNAIGGQELYSQQAFNDRGVKLSFLKSNTVEYRQFHNEFIPNLSILDVMMFNSREKTNSFLNAFSTVA